VARARGFFGEGAYDDEPMLLCLLMLAAPPELKDAQGAVWTIVDGPHETLGGGIAERQKHTLFRNGKKVGEVESGSFVQMNPRMSGSTQWRFEVSGGVFQAVGTTVRMEERKRSETNQLLRWNGKTLEPAAGVRPIRQ
jgi:hypothetical protein